MRYQLSRIIPMRFTSLYGREAAREAIEAGDGINHFRSDSHFDAEHAVWWQWRGRILRHRSVRMCVPSGI